ncbi:MAG: hypothetical protein KFKLKKLM_02651 [Flavobacteriales bacterium]|nr:hypothetical protein [Flavobacteriales bacterium]
MFSKKDKITTDKDLSINKNEKQIKNIIDKIFNDLYDYDILRDCDITDIVNNILIISIHIKELDLDLKDYIDESFNKLKNKGNIPYISLKNTYIKMMIEKNNNIRRILSEIKYQDKCDKCDKQIINLFTDYNFSH